MTADTPTTLANGVLEYAEGTTQVLRFERHLAHPVGRVWAALTEPTQLAAWLADADIDLVQGGHVELRWQNTDQDGNSAVARGTITRLEPPHVLEIDTDIHGVLCWLLRAEGEGCALTFSSTVALPAAWLPIVLAGWQIHLDHLADVLDGERIDWPNWTRDYWGQWEALRAAYTERLAERNPPTSSRTT